MRVIVDEETAAAILAPIDGGVGVDGRADEGEIGDLFRELRFQRKAVFRAEVRAAMGEDPGDGDAWSWDQLADTSRDYLVETGKDLEAMAILVEASTRLDGVAGVDASINCMADLIEAFWDEGLYPAEDEDDGVEARFQPISGLSGGSGDKEGTLIMPLRRLLLASAGGDELRWIDRVTADAQFAASQSSSAENKGELAAQASEAFGAIEALARRLSARSLRATADRLRSAEAGWRRGVQFISERTKPLFPSASRVSDELRSMREWIEGLIKFAPDDSGDDAGDEAQTGGDEAAPGDGGNGAATGGAMVLGRISNRSDALKAVVAAAEYFERFEPHAPMGPTLRDVDRRARMSLTELLAELIPDEDTREAFYWRSGIRPPQPAVEEE